MTVQHDWDRGGVRRCRLPLHLPVERLFDYVENPTIREKLKAGGAPAESYLSWKGGDYAIDSTHGSATFHGVAVDYQEIRKAADEIGNDTFIVELI
jgi:hypothetical protein